MRISCLELWYRFWKFLSPSLAYLCTFPGKHEASNQCRFAAGQPSATLDQQQTNKRSKSLVRCIYRFICCHIPEKLSQCWFHAWPESTTLSQHETNIGSASACWDRCPLLRKISSKKSPAHPDVRTDNGDVTRFFQTRVALL